MQNVYLTALLKLPRIQEQVLHLCYEPSSNTIVTLNKSNQLVLYQYFVKDQLITQNIRTSSIHEIQNTSVVFLAYLVDLECTLIITSSGAVLTVDCEGLADLKAQNDDGVLAASISPTQEYVYMITKNKTMIQLNLQFDIVNEIALDEDEECVDEGSERPTFSWRVDGSFFTINYATVNGRKITTRDNMMGVFVSPAKSDPTQQGLVQSVTEKGKPHMKGCVAWQPSGGIIAGSDQQPNAKGELQSRVIFWEKNGLRHLEFNLNSDVKSVNNLCWSLDSTILFVEVCMKNLEKKLLFYYRANYHWFLKHNINLCEGDLYFVLKNKGNKLILIRKEAFQIIDYTVELSRKVWLNEQCQKECGNVFHYFVDGSILNITDFSKCLIPPPMSMFQVNFGSQIIGVTSQRHNILVITQDNVQVYDCLKQNIVKQIKKGVLSGKILTDLKMKQFEENKKVSIQFSSGKTIYAETSESSVKQLNESELQKRSYKLTISESEVEIMATLSGTTLTVNQQIIISQQCSSFIFYHQFLLYTVSCNGMYDKLYVLNLELDQWCYDSGVGRFKDKILQMQQKQWLNHRLVERGSQMICVTNGRVVFQLPRGNLQAIYPKVIIINLVKKALNGKQYQQAFQLIRTHKLDYNLLFDLNPQDFIHNISTILLAIKRVDYINLFVSQLKEIPSTQLQYAIHPSKIQQIHQYFQLNLKDKKIKTICTAVSTTLRNIDQNNFILSIFTSQIKMGKINDVLFEIKQLRKSDQHLILPPHLQNDSTKKGKKQSSQQILEFVCWLVDADAIYEAALLTYDLQLAAMTARCTQKDPKQYIPYLQSLKSIQNVVQFKSKVCLDLKKYQIAIQELSLGNEQQIKQSLELVSQHKLFRVGLITYRNCHKQLYQVKTFIIQDLIISGQTNEAFRICQSIGNHEKALQICKTAMDSKKIKECLENIYGNKEDCIKQAKIILQEYNKDESRNKVELARLYAYVGEYEEAIMIYLKAGNYKKTFQYLPKVKPQFIRQKVNDGFLLCVSLKKNQLLKDRKQFVDKYNRLLKVQKNKKDYGVVNSNKNRGENDEMYSEVSASSKTHSSYTMSTTTGMRRKKDKNRSILTRNVKEGSPLEEEYLLAYLNHITSRCEQITKDAKLLIQHLIYLNLIQEAEFLRNQVREYLAVIQAYQVKSFAKITFENNHPEALEIYYEEEYGPKDKNGNRHKIVLNVDSFDYLL